MRFKCRIYNTSPKVKSSITIILFLKVAKRDRQKSGLDKCHVRKTQSTTIDFEDGGRGEEPRNVVASSCWEWPSVYRQQDNGT